MRLYTHHKYGSYILEQIIINILTLWYILSLVKSLFLVRFNYYTSTTFS